MIIREQTADRKNLHDKQIKKINEIGEDAKPKCTPHTNNTSALVLLYALT